jgi:hypothetical protein
VLAELNRLRRTVAGSLNFGPATRFCLLGDFPPLAGLLHSIGKAAPKSLFSVLSLWFAVPLVVLMALEAPETSGRMLEKLGAAVVAGWLAQFVLLALLVDALTGTLPRAAVLIPVVFYSSYYLEYWRQGVQVERVSQELRRTNPGRIIEFDPKQHSLVIDQAAVFAATHAIPVVYARDPSYLQDGYASYRLIERDRVKDYLGGNVEGVQFFSVEWDGAVQRSVGELRFSERPQHRVITAAAHDSDGEGWKDWNIGFRTTSLDVDGKIIGLFKSGYVYRLPPIPFFSIGCQFSSEPGNRICHAEFATERTSFESRPDSVNRVLYPDPVSIMLGIKERSKHEIARFHESDLGVRPALGEDAAFSALQDVINGRSPPLPWRTNVLIGNNPSRLAPFAAAMTDRFVALSQSSTLDVPNRLEQLSLLATGIVALRPSEFAGVADRLSDLIRTDSSIQSNYPLLYIRLSDAGPKLYSIYRDQFLAQNTTERDKLLAVTAICRIGQADTELISAINSEWAKFDSGELKNNIYQTALFVALLKLGQESAIKNYGWPNSRILRGWYEAVLAGRAKTDVGPNNCMPTEWPENTYVPSFLAPRLRWVNERWVPEQEPNTP